jgi:hypothetical protein
MAGRIRTIISDGGYRYLSDGHPRQDTSALVLEHRLTAVAWGLIDGLDDEREVYPGIVSRTILLKRTYAHASTSPRYWLARKVVMPAYWPT